MSTARRDSSRLLRCVHTDPVARVSAIERVPEVFSRVGVGVKAAEARSFSLTVISTPRRAHGQLFLHGLVFQKVTAMRNLNVVDSVFFFFRIPTLYSKGDRSDSKVDIQLTGVI